MRRFVLALILATAIGAQTPPDTPKSNSKKGPTSKSKQQADKQQTYEEKQTQADAGKPTEAPPKLPAKPAREKKQ